MVCIQGKWISLVVYLVLPNKHYGLIKLLPNLYSYETKYLEFNMLIQMKIKNKCPTAASYNCV